MKQPDTRGGDQRAVDSLAWWQRLVHVTEERVVADRVTVRHDKAFEPKRLARHSLLEKLACARCTRGRCSGDAYR